MRSLAIMYHDVVAGGDFESSGFPGEGANVYKLNRDDFERHLDAIAAAVPPGTVATISPEQHAVKPELYLTFDDGGVSASTVIAGMLEQRGWRGHFFVTTGRIGQPGFLNAEQIRNLYLSGHVIGSHSHTHPTRMAALSRAQLNEEWERSIGVLSDLLRAGVTVASVPGGYYSQQVGEAAGTAGIQALFTSEPTTKVGVLPKCLVLGRYVIQRGMGPDWSAGFAAGKAGYRWRQSLLWAAKKMAKRIGGAKYLEVRRKMLEK